MSRVRIRIGTRKSVFVLMSDGGHAEWRSSGFPYTGWYEGAASEQAQRGGVLRSVSTNQLDQLTRYRLTFKRVFLLSLPLLVAAHAPMLPSEAPAHRVYHAVESILGAGFSVLIGASFLTPAISLVGFVVTTAMVRRQQ